MPIPPSSCVVRCNRQLQGALQKQVQPAGGSGRCSQRWLQQHLSTGQRRKQHSTASSQGIASCYRNVPGKTLLVSAQREINSFLYNTATGLQMLPYNPSPQVSILNLNLLNRLAHWAREHTNLQSLSVFLEVTTGLNFFFHHPNMTLQIYLLSEE